MAFVIGACGYIGTGSSAVSDLLKEFDENQTLDRMEFKLPYRIDGLLDLRYHLCEGNMKYESGLIALKKFEKICFGKDGKIYNKMTNGKFEELVEEYLDSIIQAKWIGLNLLSLENEWIRRKIVKQYRRFGVFKLIRKFEEKKGKELEIYPLEPICFSVYPEEFNAKTKTFMMKLLKEMGWDGKKNVVLDQPFAGNNPAIAFPFFENPKAIVVDRDPRDYYATYYKLYYKNGWRQIPVSSVDDFIFCYRKMRETSVDINSKDILRINFEELVYEYENTTQKIMKFAEIEHHIYPKKFFDPEKSINNTQFYKHYPELRDAIKKIENELSEYLFDFSKYDSLNLDVNQSFVFNSKNSNGRRWKR